MHNILKTIILFLFITFFQSIKAQSYRELVMDTLSQKQDTWCWAASIEMVIKFYKPHLTDSLLQPIIVRKYSKINNWRKEKQCPDCDGNYHTMYVLKNSSTCELSMETKRYDYMDRVFSALGFHSNQEVNTDTLPIPWERLKKLIDDCRPFIVFIDPLDSEGISSNHSIVAKGYYIIDTLKYILANDPWSTCNIGRETLFPYANFRQTSGGSLKGTQINRVLSIVADLRTTEVFNSSDDCYSCASVSNAMQESLNIDTCVITEIAANTRLDLGNRQGIGGGYESFAIQDTAKINPKKNRLIIDLVKNDKIILGFKQNTVEQRGLDSAAIVNKNYATKVKYLSVNKLDKCLFFPTTFNRISANLDHAEEVIDFASGNAAIVSTFQKNKSGQWQLVGITNFTLLKESNTINFGKRKLILSNLRGGQATPNSINYELIKIPPFKYEFFSYLVDGEPMMTPCAYYDELGLEDNVAHSEKKTMKALRKVSNSFLKQTTISLGDRLRVLFGSSKVNFSISPISSKSKI